MPRTSGGAAEIWIVDHNGAMVASCLLLAAGVTGCPGETSQSAQPQTGPCSVHQVAVAGVAAAFPKWSPLLHGLLAWAPAERLTLAAAAKLL